MLMFENKWKKYMCMSRSRCQIKIEILEIEIPFGTQKGLSTVKTLKISGRGQHSFFTGEQNSNP
jgi:hypothetical protein